MRHAPAVTLCLLLSSLGCGDDSPAPRSFGSDAATSDAGSASVAAGDAAVATRGDAASSAQPDGSAATDAAIVSLPDSGSPTVSLPPANGGLDYQLGGAYPPAAGVTIVSRDRNATPASGLYNICYVNGFQAQSEENDFWLNQQPDLVLRDSGGKPVIDKDWDEMLLDVSTADKRSRLAAIEAGWIDGCKKAGFDAVEVDNLDSYSRSGGLLKEDDAVAFLALLAGVAHEKGLAIAQKNSSELVARKSELGTDFVVAEECNRYDECDDYKQGYGQHVLMIEYRQADFMKGCSAYPDDSLVLRDVDLVTPGDAKYVFDDC